MKALKASIKPFEAPQRSEKKKLIFASIKPFEAPQRSEKKKLIFASIQLSKMHRTGRVKNFAIFTEKHLRC